MFFKFLRRNSSVVGLFMIFWQVGWFSWKNVEGYFIGVREVYIVLFSFVE